MFDMRRREEAEGESRIIGSGRRAGVLEFIANEGLLAMLEIAFLEKKGAASLRTWEKSCYCVSTFARKHLDGHTVGLIPLNALFRSPILRSPL